MTSSPVSSVHTSALTVFFLIPDPFPNLSFIPISCRRLHPYPLLFYANLRINPWAAMWIASQAPPKTGA
jgi:hypothetical protein